MLDALCVLLVLLAAVVAVSGGFRQHVGGLRIGITSPLPLALWAIAIAVVRHLAAPQSPIYRGLPDRVNEWRRWQAVRSAALTFAGTRPVVLFVGYLAVFMIGYAGGRAPLRHFNNELLNLPVRWDAGWYLQIVTDGYKYAPDQPSLQQNIVFFPAYPMLVRGIGRLLGGHMAGYVAAGTALSLVAFFGALTYLFAFTRDAIGEEKARCTLWLLAAYPFALFFGALYTESLFLLGVTGAFYHFTRQQFGRAAFWGLLVGLTRLNGALLSIPLAILAVSPWLPAALVRRTRADGTGSPSPMPTDTSSLLKAFAAAAMPGVGLLLYAAFIWNLTGDPMAWAAGQLAWGRKYEGLATLVSRQYAIVANAGVSGYVSTPGYDILNALGALFAVSAIWPVARRVGLAYAVFIAINTLPALATGGLLSAGRFSSVLFPAFIWLADTLPPGQRTAWIASFAAFQAYNATLFYTWRPLF